MPVYIKTGIKIQNEVISHYIREGYLPDVLNHLMSELRDWCLTTRNIIPWLSGN